MGTTASMGLLDFDSSGKIPLAWHLIALVLLMIASILAVLTNSVDLMRKLIVYWILLSFLFLFEIPYWSCVGLVVIFLCFVKLCFGGACLACQGSTHFLTKLLQVVIVRFLKQREGRLLERETLLNVVKRYIQEYGSRFVGRLTVLQKQRERQKHNNFKSDTKIIEREGENTAVTSNQVNGEEMTENGCTRIVTPPLMQTQQERFCAACSLTFPSRSALHAHYHRSTHKSKSESQKTSAKDTGASTSSTPDSVLNVEEMTPPKENRWDETPPLIQQKVRYDPYGFSTPYQSRWNGHILRSLHKTNLESSKARDTRSSPSVQHKHSVSAPSSPIGKYKALEVEDSMPAEESREKGCLKTTSKNGTHFHGRKHQFKELVKDKSKIGAKYNKGTSPSATSELNYGSEAEKTLPLKTEWRCDLCKVMTKCENNLNAHYLGRKHQAKLLKQSKIGAKDRGPSPSATSELNHGNEAEKFTKESGSESEKLRESKAPGQYGNSGNEVWIPKGGVANAEAVKEKRSGNLHERKKMPSDDLQKPKLGSRKTSRLPAEEDTELSPSATCKQTGNI